MPRTAKNEDVPQNGGFHSIEENQGFEQHVTTPQYGT